MRLSRTLSCVLAVFATLTLAASASQAGTWYVATTGSDTLNDGKSTTSPFATIQHAINTATAGDTIMVAAGTYREWLDWEKDLSIQGSGQGLSIIDPSAANGGPGGRCILAANLTSASHLAGFTLQHGHAAVDEPSGGGLFNASSNLIVSNCAFVDNSGSGVGNGSSSPRFVNCTFAGNSARMGGGMSNGGSSPTLVNCTFSGNHASFGGAIWEDASNPTVYNCTFAGNSAGVAGGIYSQENAYPQLTNCILWGDTGGEILNGTGGEATATYSDVQGGYSGTGNVNADPLFVRNPTIVLSGDGTVNVSASDFGDLRLQAASPCVDTGNSAVVTAANGFLMDPTSSYFIDLAGNPRISGTAVDMGAYEFQSVLLQAESKVQTLMNSVTNLVGGDAMQPASGQPLYAKLDAAIAYLQAGDSVDAISVLQAFANQVRAFVKTGRLTFAQGQALISEAQTIMTLLGG